MLGNASPTADLIVARKARSSLFRRQRIPRAQRTPLGYLNAILDDHASEPVLAMAKRKIWVKRPGSSPTQVTIGADDLMDDVRDMILRKYANSLGRSFDSPDVTLKLIIKEAGNNCATTERILGPDEHMGTALDAAYPAGQTIDDALIIDVPKRRTPRPSPMVGHHMPYYIAEELRPEEAAGEYFPPMPAMASPRLNHVTHATNPHHPSHAMAVLTTGQLPPLPSPGSRTHRHHGRPKYGRQHTSSPTVLHSIPSSGSLAEAKQSMNGTTVAPAPPLPSPPLQAQNPHKPSITPPNRSSSPRPGQKPKKTKKNATPVSASNPVNGDPPPPLKPASAGLLDGTVPPINVLIVEDNVINLKLLEQFMRRLRVRWKTAMNGQEAVNQWRTGGFHLVLMDIQLPVMNGLEATKEIRRLEGLNGIGVFSGSPVDVMQAGQATDGDNLEKELFKSPVIIVALTASSLQSDRHEALAAGCNDFLTKPVNFAWMERKVTEWGCMQALIDFDGWRKWKDYASSKTAQQEKDEKAAARAALKAQFAKRPSNTKAVKAGA